MSKYLYYKVDGRRAKVRADKQAEFESKYPDAKIYYSYQGRDAAVPLSGVEEFKRKYGAENVHYSVFDDFGTTTKSDSNTPTIREEKHARIDERHKNDRTNIFETIGKSVAAAGVTTAKLALDLGRTAWKATIPGMLWGDSLDEVTRDMSNPITRASVKLGETAERLSREADPTGGEKGFVELLKDGKVGMAMQKALGSGLESLPMMLAASTGVGAVAYGAAMAAGNYADETRENPEIAAWKRGANAVGSAALELAVERIGGPLKKVFGKAGKELTEEAAKEILEQIARESKEEIATRIVKGIGRLGKEGLEEGGEEFLTSFGNDALGQGLDWIDGNKDYGIRAQWDQYKEQNPDADKMAFALEKAEEYFDAFLGGALSGAEISGVTSAISERGKSKRQAYIDSEMKKAHELGAAMDYRDMYDVYKEVNKDIDNAAETFINDKGEATISREFIENLTAKEAITLSQSNDFSKEQRAALAELAWAKAGQEGLNQKIDQRVEDNINAAKARIDKATENGQVISGMVNGRVVYVSGGVAKNGSVHISEDGTDGPVLVIDSVTGEETTVNSKEITSAKSADATEVFSAIENSFRQRAAQDKETAINTMSPKAKIDSIQEYAGKKIMVDLGGGMIEVEVQEVSPKTGEVRIKGKKGDLGGQSIISLGADVIYDSLVRGDDGAPVVIDDGKPIEDEEDVEEPVTEQPVSETPVEPTTEQPTTEEVTTEEPKIVENEDYRDGTYTILIDGKPVPVYVTNQDDQANTLVYEYEDEKGNTKRGRTSITGFGEAIQQAVDFTPEAPVVEEPEVNVVVPTDEVIPAEEGVPQAPSEIPATPQTIDWDVLFDTDPENYFAEIQNQFGEDATDMLTAVVEATQQELDSLNKNKGKTQSEIFENVSKRKALQKKIDTLNGMIARLTSAPETEAVAEPIAETPVEQVETTPEAPVAETAPVVEEVVEEETVEPEPIEQTPEAEVVEDVEPIQQPVVPVAPNPVDDPVESAKEREKQLLKLLERPGVDENLKKDAARRAGKEVADMFATEQDYDDYLAEAANLGEYESFFNEGVKESFANRNNNTNTGNPQGNSVSLETEPKVENNGDQTEESQREVSEGHNDRSRSELSDDEGTKESGTPIEEVGRGETGESGSVVDKYPVRSGDISHQTLKDTFGLRDVSSEVNTENLNSIYDLLMEMAKMLGISPKSIGHGGSLGVENYNSPHNHIRAQYSYRQAFDGTVKNPVLRFRNAALSSIAHEWWHSLDSALAYYETGKTFHTSTNSNKDNFTGREEVLKAVKDVLKAINKSGHKDRLDRELYYNRGFLKYSKQKDEMSARAFEEYIKMKLEQAGVDVDTYSEPAANRPTADEMAVIAPAFDKLFDVLKEKEGRNTGTSVLYHIGEMMEPNSEAKQIATEVVLQALKDAKIEVERVTNEQAQKMLEIRDQLSNIEMMTVFHGSGNKFDEFNHAHMGEGEGAQAHGWGTYVAKEEATSMYYARMGRVSYLGSMSDLDANQQEVINNIINLISVGYTFEEAINEGKEQWKKLSLNSDSRAKRSFLDSLTPDDFKMRYLYSVEIPDYDGSNYIDEQSMTREQAEKLYEACQKNGLDYSKVIEGDGLLDNRGDGRKVYSSLTKMLGSDKAASEFLSRAGFVGIKYTGRTDGDCFVIFNEADANITGRTEFYQTPDGVVYGWTDGKKIYLTEAGMNPNTPVHEYTHLWARAMMQNNPKGWNSIKQLLKKTPVWNEVIKDKNYESISKDEDAVASEVLSRISGSKNAEKLEQMAQQMLDNAKGTMRKAEARGLIQNIKDALDKFWNWVGKELFKIENFSSIDEVTDRVLWDLMNQTDLRNGISEKSSISLHHDETTDTYTSNDGGRISPEADGVQEEASISEPLSEGRKLARPSDGEVSRNDNAQFNPISQREGESERSRNNREAQLYTDDTSIKDEIAAIKEKSIADGTFKKSPNGKPTNLSEEQWLTVRTKAFKNWFGDWELGYLYKRAIEAWNNPSSKGKFVAQLSKKARDRFNELLGNDAKQFIITDDSIRHIKKEHSKGEELRGQKNLTPEDIVILPYLVNNFDSMELVPERNDKLGNRAVLIKKRINGISFIGTIERGKNKEFLVTNYEFIKSDALDASNETPERNVRNDSDITNVKREIENIKSLAINSSKVVDENGEPLVVYHGTGNEFYTFRNTSEDNELGSGFYFTDSYNTAERYAKDENLADNQNRIQSRADDIFFDIMGHSQEDLYDNEYVGDYNLAYEQAVYELFSNSHVKGVFLNIRKPYVVSEDKSGVSIYNGAAIAHHNNDGIIDDKFSERHDTLSGVQYVAFSPNQIKSATDNVGTFDAENPDIRYRKSEAQNAAVDYLVGDPRLRAIENAVNEEASKLGVQVTYKTREQMPDGHKNDKGYYDTETGEVVICTENASSIADAIQTILHEAVAHKGLRQLMGDKFNEFIDRVYNSLDAETKAKVDKLAAEQHDGNTAVAMEEYMASLAEKENFAENSVWDKIKSIFEDIINTILGRDDIKIGDNELRYILRASYNNMVNPRNMDSIRGWAQDQLMREEYKINVATPKILSRTGIDPNEKVQDTAKEVYERVIKSQWQEFQRQFQDAMQPMRIVVDAIQQETGNTPIEDYENFLLMHNHSDSRTRVETDIFKRKHFIPIVEWINKMITDILEARGENVKNSENRSRIYSEIMQYLMAKHGLERNKYYQEHRTRKLEQYEKDKEKKAADDAYGERIRSINEDPNLSEAERELALRKAEDEYNAQLVEINEREVPDVRDYSGLTALFGMDHKKFREAEAEAQRLVDEFEAELGEMPRELWDRINAATNKTLRHSYECGLISRRQYNEIKSMFKYYIPLRGFDETTAEDVYSYARFEGNRFSPAVAKAGGRTSLADDPLAFILSMAESEIAQGSKNRAKQALYHFILNRTITDDEGNEHQNTLMQVEDVWYVQNVDDNGNTTYTIATPDHESGQTVQEFEEKMRELEAEGKAQKSKKGQPDLGMRFQKQRNKNAHYVFLKVNGVDKAIYINGDPKAAEAINGMDKPTPGELEKKMKSINRFISSTFTNYSLEFTARNYFRDMLYSHINIDIKESDPEYRKKFRQNWRHNNLRTMMNMLKAFKSGELDWRNLTEDEAAFVEFMKNGGQTGYTMLNSVENHKRDLEKSIERMRNGVENGGVKDSAIFKHTLGAIELLNEASELVTRFAAFKTSRDLGRDMLTSINDAKEITVNFNTKGAQDGKGWMGMMARYFGWSKFFFNASVEGVQNIKSMSEANKLKFGSVVGGIVATGFMVPVLTAAISQLFGGDDDEYWNIPEYDRQNNFCLVLGNGLYVKIPLPIGFREMYAMGDMVAAMAFDKKFKRDVGDVGLDMANKVASVVLPINPLESRANGLSLLETIAYTLSPSSTQFIIQGMTNKDWKGAPLQKEYTYNENDPAWMKAFDSNPAWMTGLSKWCNEHIGTGDYKGMDWSPEKLDNTLSGLFGGVYSLTKKFGRSISMIWNEENRNLSNIPLSGVVIGSGIDEDDRFVTDAFYEQQDFYDERIGYIKRRAEKFGYDLDDVFLKEKGKHHPKMQEIYSNKHFDFMQEWYKGSDDLKKLNKKVKDQEKKIAAKENPTDYDLEKLGKLQDKFNIARREFVEDMLELD